MLRKMFLSLLLITFLASGAARPQSSSLSASRSGWIAGVTNSGNITASNANTLGGWGHFSLGVDASLAHPKVAGTPVTASAVSATLCTGILKGRNLGPVVHGLGSLDFYFKTGRLTVNGRNSESSGLWGTGVRLGVLRNSIITPAVSLSLGYNSSGEMPLERALSYGIISSPKSNFSSLALRLDVSKNFFWLTPFAGVGINRNRMEQKIGSVRAETKATENIGYAGVEWNLFLFRIGLELGRTGEELFGSLGVRLAI